LLSVIMSLGLAKDSMVNLAELVSRMEDEAALSSGKDSNRVVYDSDGGKETLIEVNSGPIRPDDDEDGDDDDYIPSVESMDSKDSAVLEDELLADDTIHRVNLTLSDKRRQEDGDSSQQPEQQAKEAMTPSVDQDDASRKVTDGVIPSSSVPSLTPASDIDKLSSNNGSDVVSIDSSTQRGRDVGQYSGFVTEYQDFDNYSFVDSYSGFTNNGKGTFVPAHFEPYSIRQEAWWCCLFPWAGGDRMIENDEMILIQGDGGGGGDGSSVNTETSEQPVTGVSTNVVGRTRDSGKEEDEVSVGSDVFGEKLSDKDRQAVLARLRLAQPDTGSSNPSHGNNGAGTVGGDPSNTSAGATAGQNGGDKVSQNEPVYPPNATMRKSPKSILRRTATSVGGKKSLDKLANQKSERGPVRRSLFPSYEKQVEVKKDLHTTFAPMARVVTIKSLKDMEAEEKGDIWWQRPDYEEFRRTGRMITKAMLEGGSEVWLATNQSWQLPNQGKAATFHRATSLSERHAAFQKGDLSAKIDYEVTRDKWWHKFGHSRRGLEHIASIDEGRQRQANVKTSIKAVLDEQRRQHVFHREDPEKLRMVYMQNTSWAKDLSLASGASDADAVAKDFDDESRRSREFYLLKFSRANAPANAPKSATSVVPAFMKPAVKVTMPVPPNRFDANTTSQIRYRQTQQTPSSTKKLSSSSAVGGGSQIGQGRLSIEVSLRVPINDDRDDSSKDTLARKAAGYASGDEIANMAAVLSGMGPIPKNATAIVGGA
jgi:hypothetical protein